MAALQIFISYFRLSENTTDLASEVCKHMNRRQSALVYKHIGISGENEQGTGEISLGEMHTVETKASQYKVEARYDKGIKLLNDAFGTGSLFDMVCWSSG